MGLNTLGGISSKKGRGVRLSDGRMEKQCVVQLVRIAERGGGITGKWLAAVDHHQVRPERAQ